VRSPENKKILSERTYQQASAFDEVDKALGELLPGLITHNIPTQMKVGRQVRVVARIIGLAGPTPEAVTQGQQTIAKGLELATSPEGIQVSTTMKARLVGAEDDFHIESQSVEEQIIDRDQPAEWVWFVTPKRSGTHRLRLSAVAVVKLGGAEKSKELPVFDREVTVAVSFGYFLSRNWKEITGAISGTGILGWLTARFQKRRKGRRRKGR
jgi:hypothetical protein